MSFPRPESQNRILEPSPAAKHLSYVSANQVRMIHTQLTRRMADPAMLLDPRALAVNLKDTVPHVSSLWLAQRAF